MPRSPTAGELDALMEYARTDGERQAIEAIKNHGSLRSAAAKTGIDRDTITKRLNAVRRAAANQGVSPDHNWNGPVPDGYKIKGVSQLVSGNGEVVQTWYKSDTDHERREALIQAALEGFKESVPKAKPQAKPRHKVRDGLLNLYTITDYHLGMYAWHEETGDDWDMKISENLLVAWFEEAISQSPAAEQAVFAQLGDFMHFDSLEAVTPTNRNILDADTRHQLMVRVALRVLRRCVALLLAKHERVHIIMAEGNHDPAGSAWLREAFAIFYEDEPRVTVDTSPDPYYGYQWGNTALFFHHGHKRKVTNIADVFAAKYREMFGSTQHAYAHMGHLHHKHVLETNLMVVEQHRTLAAKDAYASSGGWMAGRDAQVITYSKEFGEVGRVIVSPNMVRAA